ncbi:hypothetical protein HNQ96_005358 [Aminobacter lissarensis]|uniref:Uncharacterized protein n=1 Tax=Aminobacter carboxidus TaxID=376165 RepID=A0A8E1WK62_9HYPH|nr:hypothetical protein [Aminobacter lissarensis]MBB6469468.1 hypothetical protein [Aminobacter lissarensis]
MNDTLLVNGLVKRLEAAGYTRLATPFKVATVDFEFTAALRGSDGRGLDLILIVDTATGDHGDRDATRVRQRIETLSRALDITQSRYVLTVILAGAMLQGDIEALSATCRVLSVESASLDASGRPINSTVAEALDDQIRVLLPLDLGWDEGDERSSKGDTMTELLAALPRTLDRELVDALVEASIHGDEAVTQALGTRLGDVLTLGTSS